MIKRTKTEKWALIVVDVQNDFCPGGSLAVPKGDEVIGPINAMISLALKKKKPIFFSRDWHPKVTGHFKNYGGDWPPHCIMYEEGAKFHHAIKIPKSAFIISKGMVSGEDAYSAFDGETLDGDMIDDLLRALKVTKVYVCGLATDFCVKATVISASEAGYKVVLLRDACRAVFPDKEAELLKTMEEDEEYCSILTTKDALEQ